MILGELPTTVSASLQVCKAPTKSLARSLAVANAHHNDICSSMFSNSGGGNDNAVTNSATAPSILPSIVAIVANSVCAILAILISSREHFSNDRGKRLKHRLNPSIACGPWPA
ncbi:unnamed protein product [Debaryomyces fabryi]|nr:unnamed protein product [Debaryomyces fabryi]